MGGDEAGAGKLFGSLLNGPKKLMSWAVFALVIWAGWVGYKWMTGKDHLRVDNLTLFESPEKLKEHYPFSAYSYVGSLDKRTWTQLTQKDYFAVGSPEQMEYLAVLNFKILRPGSEVSKVMSQQIEKAMASGGTEKYDPTAISKIKLFTLESSLEIAGNTETQVLNYFYQDPAFSSFLFGQSDIIAIDPGNSHVLKYPQIGDAEFSDNCNEVKFTGKIKGSLSRIDTLPPVDLKGYYHLNMKLIDARTTAHLTNIIKRKYIKMTVPALFSPSGVDLGKLQLFGSTYPMRGYKDPSGMIKIFLGTDHFITIKPGMTTYAYLNSSYDKLGGDGLFATYLVSLEKAALPGEKETEMLSHSGDIGTLPNNVRDLPASWSYYEDIKPYELTQDDWNADEHWKNISGVEGDLSMKLLIGQLPKSGGTQTAPEQPKQTKPTARTKPANQQTQPPAAKTPAPKNEDDAIMDKLKDRYKKRM